MASGSSNRPNSAPKGFDFGSDNILCSYEDYGNQESSNGSHSDSLPIPSANSNKQDFHKSRMGTVFPPAAYSQPEDSFKQDVISTVENSMKKYSDNLLRFLEGISSRLSQLELYCYNLDKSVGEMRSELVHEHEEADSKLKSLEKNLQEVHRSVQIIRDKQELVETQKELAKLQLLQKESSANSHSHSNEERASPLASEFKKNETQSETHNQQLALALTHQIVPHQHSITAPSAALPQNVPQQQSYYVSSAQLPSQPTHIQHPQSQYRPSDPQYQASQLQDASRLASQMTNSQLSQTPSLQQFSQYPQQWPQQSSQQVQPPQQPSMQPQIRPPPTSVYHSYPASQPTSIPETLPNNVHMQMSFSPIPQPGSSRMDTVPYGYSGSGVNVPQQPPQVKSTFGPPAGEGYMPSGQQPVLPSGGAYMMYDRESGRPSQHPPQPPHHPPQQPHSAPQQMHHPPQQPHSTPQQMHHPPQQPHSTPQQMHHPPQQSHFSQGGYHPTNAPIQSQLPPAGPRVMTRNPSHSQFMRNHPYSDVIEKLVVMGFRGDHVAGVIQMMEETGQPIDFNAVLDRLNTSASPQRVW